MPGLIKKKKNEKKASLTYSLELPQLPSLPDLFSRHFLCRGQLPYFLVRRENFFKATNLFSHFSPSREGAKRVARCLTSTHTVHALFHPPPPHFLLFVSSRKRGRAKEQPGLISWVRRRSNLCLYLLESSRYFSPT